MKKVTKGEKKLYFSGVFCLVLTIIIKIFLGASIGNFVQNQFRAEDSYNNFMASALDALKVLPEEEQAPKSYEFDFEIEEEDE